MCKKDNWKTRIEKSLFKNLKLRKKTLTKSNFCIGSESESAHLWRTLQVQYSKIEGYTEDIWGSILQDGRGRFNFQWRKGQEAKMRSADWETANSLLPPRQTIATVWLQSNHQYRRHHHFVRLTKDGEREGRRRVQEKDKGGTKWDQPHWLHTSHTSVTGLTANWPT